MRNKISIIIIGLFVFLSCSRLTKEQRELRNNINKTVNLNPYDSVRYRDSKISFNEFRSQFDYISVVYLENGCRPCYSKYINWQNKMNSIVLKNKSTVLFIEQGDSYDGFITKVNKIDSVRNKFYFIEDFNFRFLYNNAEIPRWIINRSLLIDKKNKIKLIGEPFASPEIRALYRDICRH
jgi:hypothetical protein